MDNSVWSIHTIYGEFIGRVDSTLTENHITKQGFIVLHNPLKLYIQLTPQGLMHDMIPVTHFSEPESLVIDASHLISYGTPTKDVETAYLQKTSGIMLPPAQSKLTIVS